MSFSRYLNFCFDFFVMWNIGLIRKISLISKYVTSRPGSHIIQIHILTNISRTKCNQAMKFGQLIVCDMWNIFLNKSYTKYGGETIPRPFSEKSKLSISLDQWPKVLCNLFLLYAKVSEDYYSILKLSSRPLAFPSCNKAFLKIKKN